MSALVGGWALARFVVRDDAGEAFPFGEDAEGLIVYGADGWMSAVLSRRGRALPGATRLEDAHRASLEARAAAFDGYLSYAGRWRLLGGVVEHHVALASNPAAIGQVQRREVRFTGEGVELGYTLPSRHGPRRFELAWRRAGRGE